MCRGEGYWGPRWGVPEAQGLALSICTGCFITARRTARWLYGQRVAWAPEQQIHGHGGCTDPHADPRDDAVFLRSADLGPAYQHHLLLLRALCCLAFPHPAGVPSRTGSQQGCRSTNKDVNNSNKVMLISSSIRRTQEEINAWHTEKDRSSGEGDCIQGRMERKTAIEDGYLGGPFSHPSPPLIPLEVNSHSRGGWATLEQSGLAPFEVCSRITKVIT